VPIGKSFDDLHFRFPSPNYVQGNIPLFQQSENFAANTHLDDIDGFLTAAKLISKENNGHLVDLFTFLQDSETGELNDLHESEAINEILKNTATDTDVKANDLRNWIKNNPEAMKTVKMILSPTDGRASGIPFEISKFQQLAHFSWCNSPITTLLPSFGRLAALDYLDVEQNENLKRLPPCIAKLKALKSIQLDYELIEGDSYVVSNLDQLNHIVISFNQDETTRTFSIPFLNAMFCGFLEFYHASKNLPHLQVADRYNQIFGEIGSTNVTDGSAANWVAGGCQYILIKDDDVKAFQCGLRIYHSNQGKQ
jgi:hypothetical protein